jgi:hypothetical protein
VTYLVATTRLLQRLALALVVGALPQHLPGEVVLVVQALPLVDVASPQLRVLPVVLGIEVLPRPTCHVRVVIRDITCA